MGSSQKVTNTDRFPGMPGLRPRFAGFTKPRPGRDAPGLRLPAPAVKTNWPSVKRVESIIGHEVILRPVEIEAGVSYPIRVSPDGRPHESTPIFGAEVGVRASSLHEVRPIRCLNRNQRRTVIPNRRRKPAAEQLEGANRPPGAPETNGGLHDLNGRRMHKATLPRRLPSTISLYA